MNKFFTMCAVTLLAGATLVANDLPDAPTPKPAGKTSVSFPSSNGSSSVVPNRTGSEMFFESYAVCGIGLALSNNRARSAEIGLPVVLAASLLQKKLHTNHPKLGYILQGVSSIACFDFSNKRTQREARGGGNQGGNDGNGSGSTTGGSSGGSNGSGGTGNGSSGSGSGGSTSSGGSTGSSGGGTGTGSGGGTTGGSGGSGGSGGGSGSGSGGSGSGSGGGTSGGGSGSGGGTGGGGNGNGCTVHGGTDCGFGNGGLNNGKNGKPPVTPPGDPHTHGKP